MGRQASSGGRRSCGEGGVIVPAMQDGMGPDSDEVCARSDGCTMLHRRNRRETVTES